MARVFGIRKGLEKEKVDPEQIRAIIGGGDLVQVILRMEASLDLARMRRILEACGCTGGKKTLDHCRAVGEQMAGKPLREKIAELNETSDGQRMVLNEDHTLTMTMRFVQNGKYACVCSAAVTRGVRISDLALRESDSPVMPLSYCYCCAGASRLHTELKLGHALRVKEILSSPIHSRGSEPCAFVLEML